MMRWIATLSTAVLTLLVLARAAAAQDYAPPPQAPYVSSYGGAPAPAPGPGCCAGYSVPSGPSRPYTPAYAAGQVQPSYGLSAPCCASAPPAYGGGGGYGQPQGQPRIYVEDMYGQWHEATGEEYARVYAYAQQQPQQPGSPYQYVNVPGPCCGNQPPAPPPYTPPPPSCGGGCYPPAPPPPPCGGGCYPPAPPSGCGGCCAPSYPSPGYPPAPSGCGEVRLNDSFFYGSGGVGPEVIHSGGGGGYAFAGAGASASSWASASAGARVSIGGGRGYRPPPHRPPPGSGGKGKGGCGCH